MQIMKKKYEIRKSAVSSFSSGRLPSADADGQWLARYKVEHILGRAKHTPQVSYFIIVLSYLLV